MFRALLQQMERNAPNIKKVIQGADKFPELSPPSNDPKTNPILKKKKKKKNKNKANNRFDKIVENAKIRKNVKYYNSIINECAKRRNLHSAIQLFDQLKSQSLTPNLFTYSAILNACVRNGAMTKAQEYFDEMKTQKVQLNEVIYTILIKGYSNSDLAKAVKLVEEMEDSNIVPNRRTFNTILRACVRTGNLSSAKKIFKKMKKQGLKHDPIAQAILCKLYAQELKVDRALRYFNRLLKQYPDQSYEDRSVNDKFNKNKQKDDEDEDPTANYKIEPMLYILLASVCAITKRKKDAEKILDQLKTRMPDDKMSGENIRDKEQILQYLKTIEGSNDKMEVDEDEDELDVDKITAFRSDPQVFIVDDEEDDLASRLKKVLKKIAKKSKLAFEIGPGSGHWLAKKAAEDLSYHWVAIEKRFERSFEIWLKRKLVPSLDDNITVICGDVHRVLDALPSDSIDKVFINFPDPPASYDAVEKTSFVNTILMKKIQKALVKKGSFVVLTDDRVLHGEFKTMIEALAGEKLVEELKNADQYVDADTQSFFDNLWKRKGRNDRFAIGFTKAKNE